MSSLVLILPFFESQKSRFCMWQYFRIFAYLILCSNESGLAFFGVCSSDELHTFFNL